MNSILTCQLPAINLMTPKTFNKKEVLRTRPPPDFLQVLIVDDDRRRGAANAKIIKEMGHSVELAGNGITALRMAAANRPDAVLLNTNLSGSDDCDVSGHLRSDYPVLPPLIIGFASHTNSLTRWQCVKAGMDLVLEAPLNATAIETLLLFECAKLTVERKKNRQSDHTIGQFTSQHDLLPLTQARSIEANQLLSNQLEITC